jgi:hypothetical protein
MMGDEKEIAAVDLKDHRIMGITKTSRARRDLCERALHVLRRACDYPQDFRGGALLLARLGQLSGPAFELAFEFVYDASC